MTPAVTAVKVISVPIDRSMPPVMMIIVTAMASTPFTAAAWSTARMFVVCRKFGEATEKNATSTIRLAKAQSICWAAAPPRRGAGLGSGAVASVMGGLPRRRLRESGRSGPGAGWRGA